MLWAIPTAALAAGVALLATGVNEREPAERPKLALMTALPIVWGEGGVDDILAGRGGPSEAYKRLDARFQVEPIDAISAAALKGHRLMLLAQPRALAPGELFDLDAWVRGDGRALILTDPMLVWPSGFGLGHPQRPPAVGLLDPLLAHWGLSLEGPAEGEPVAIERRVDGAKLRLAAPGRFVATGDACRVTEGGLVARCRIGGGEAVLVADADLLDARLWDGDGNMAAVEAWLAELRD